MPIDKAQFDRGQGLDDAQRVLQFLQRHPDQAFTLPEICQGIGQPLSEGQATSTLISVAFATAWMSITLDELIKKGQVASKIIGAERYYTVS